MGARPGNRGIPMQQQQDGDPRARLLEERGADVRLAPNHRLKRRAVESAHPPPAQEVLGTVADALAASGVRRDKNRAGCPRFTLQTGDGDLDSKFSTDKPHSEKFPSATFRLSEWLHHAGTCASPRHASDATNAIAPSRVCTAGAGLTVASGPARFRDSPTTGF
ncbi:hypothetical protein ACCO45_007824 [Purpureocillium lilacinum]|uniref:Uncharacterized protein n=1 Tax=Purpureocillium lilacinum TaxID=33203 RepID=A0ACC4DLV8_PURLI